MADERVNREEEQRNYTEWLNNRNDFDLKRRFPRDSVQRVLVVGHLKRSTSGLAYQIEPFSDQTPIRAQTSGGGASGVTIGPATGIRWRVHEIVADFQCDATVAARTAVVRIQKGQGTAFWAGTKYAWDSDGLSLTASQYGMLFIPANGGGYCYKNTNDTLAAGTAGKNPCPFVLDGTYTEVVQAYYTANGQAGDTTALVVYYEVIP